MGDEKNRILYVADMLGLGWRDERNPDFAQGIAVVEYAVADIGDALGKLKSLQRFTFTEALFA